VRSEGGDLEAGHGGAETLADRREARWILPRRRGIDDCPPAPLRVGRLEDPRLPTKTDSAPSIMQSAASAGVAMPPAAKFGTGRRPFPATQRTSS
jgi:hypothetical protein